jgi:hypothetical protein
MWEKESTLSKPVGKSLSLFLMCLQGHACFKMKASTDLLVELANGTQFEMIND